MLGRDPVSFLLQKSGHFLEYALLALVLYRAVRGTLWILRGTGTGGNEGDADPELARGPYLWALALTILYAISDEWHQSVIPHREPTLRDVLIDTAGALTALAATRKALSRRRAAVPDQSGSSPPAQPGPLGPQAG